MFVGRSLAKEKKEMEGKCHQDGIVNEAINY